ncbi:MAG: CoA transferase [Thermoplasmata archaeon]|nr:CoA transferase [Thermoplasmata archaeon]
MAGEDAGTPLPPRFGPLAGVRVLDSGRFVAGPWAATYLGEFGARVVKVEGPPFGPPFSDPTRTLPPTLPVGAGPESSVSESWVQYSRNKLSVGLDVRKPEGRSVFLDLARQSDIWVESSRPGTYARLGLPDEALWALNPALTIVHVSGYGQTGEPARISSPSYDLVAQAYSGYLSLQGNPEPEPPMRSGTAFNDTVTGLAAAGAALMGYINARSTGHGQSVDVAQYEVFFTLLENLALDYFARGVVRGRHGRAHARLHPYDVHRALDGWVVVAAPTDDSWARLRKLIGIKDPGADSADWRRGHRDEVDDQIARFCAGRSAESLEAIGRGSDLAIARVLSMEDIARDPHYRERSMIVGWTDPVAGPVQGAGVSPAFSRTPGGVWRGAPWLGQDNRGVLGGLLGYGEERLSILEATHVIGEYRPVMARAGPPAAPGDSK